MSELGLTLARLAFLVLLWAFVLGALWALRRDLRQPAEARPSGRSTTGRTRTPRAPRTNRVRGTKLVVTEGALAGTVIPLTGAQITVGRAPDSTLVIEDDYASSRHARVYSSEGTWLVEDLGSTNGTWLDRTRITTPTVLAVGVPLRVGRTTLVLQK